MRASPYLVAMLTTALMGCGEPSVPTVPLMSVESVASIYDAGPASNAAFGVVVSGLIDRDSAAQEWLAQKVRNAGFKYVRDGVYWSRMQPVTNIFDAEYLRRARQMTRILIRNGLVPYITLSETPFWARKCFSPPADPGDTTDTCHHNRPPHPDMWIWWREFVRGMNDSLPEVNHWGVWNEPDDPNFLVVSGEDATWHDTYFKLYQYAADAIPTTESVHAPELSVGDGGVSVKADLDTFVYRNAFRLVNRPKDILTVHIYRSEKVLRDLASAYNTIASSRGVPNDIWITESADGCPLCEVDQPTQATLAMYHYQLVDDAIVPRVKKIFRMPFDEWVEPGVRGVPIIENGIPRLAYDCLRTLARRLPTAAGCTGSTSASIVLESTSFSTCTYRVLHNVPVPSYKWRVNSTTVNGPGPLVTIPHFGTATVSASIVGDWHSAVAHRQCTCSSAYKACS